MVSRDWDADERGMTPDELADVFDAGADALRGEQRSSRTDLLAVLLAMRNACKHVERRRNSRHG